jgi:transposase
MESGSRPVFTTRTTAVFEEVVNMTTIGMDLGVTASTEVAVADGSHIESTKKVASSPDGLVAALREAAAGRPVSIVLESTAMAWFVAAVAAVRAGVDHRLFRVSGQKAAALRRFYRTHTKTDRIDASVLARMPAVDDALLEFTLPPSGEMALKRLITLRHKLVRETTRLQGRIRSTLHWAAPGMLSGRDGVTDGFVEILARWPDLRRLARARVATIVKTGPISPARGERIRNAAREAVDFYDGFVDFDALALELEVATAHLSSLQTQLARLERRISALHRRQHPNDPLLTVPGIGEVVAPSSARRSATSNGSPTSLRSVPTPDSCRARTPRASHDAAARSPRPARRCCAGRCTSPPTSPASGTPSSPSSTGG